MTKIYLAGSCGSDKRTMLKNIATQLRAYNYEVYCPFELQIPNAWDMTQEEWSKKVFDADVAAIDACDIFLMIIPGRHSTAGTNWEQGYAYAKGKYIIVLQYTNDNTSLMTYTAANEFINCTELDLATEVVCILHGGFRQEGCKTVLT